MRGQDCAREAGELLQRLGWEEAFSPRDAWSAPNPSAQAERLSPLIATTLTGRGGEIGKLARLFNEVCAALTLGVEESRQLAAALLALRLRPLASHEQNRSYSNQFEQGSGEKSLPYFIKKASPMTPAEQGLCWESIVNCSCPSLIERVAQLGVDPNARGPGDPSPLARVSFSHPGNILALIKRGARPDGDPQEPASPLLLAFERASAANAQALIEGGATGGGSRLPEDLEARVGRLVRAGFLHERVKNSPEMVELRRLARALGEQAAMEAAAAAPNAASLKAPRL